MLEFSDRNSSENLCSSLLLLHAARLMTWVIEVRPAVDLSWKALWYIYWACDLHVTCTARQRKWQKNTIEFHCWISHSRAILNGIHIAVVYNVLIPNSLVMIQQALFLIFLFSLSAIHSSSVWRSVIRARVLVGVRPPPPKKSGAFEQKKNELSKHQPLKVSCIKHIYC